MKKRYTLLSALVAVLLLTLSSCVSGDALEPDTQLEITVQSTAGGVHQDAQVRLFTSLNDWIAGINQVGETKLTDAEGKVLFTDLESKKYFWLVEKGCLNNVFGFSTTTNPIRGGKRNVVSTTIEGTGVVRLISASNNAFQVYVDGEEIAIFDPMETQEFRVKEGNYTIRVLEVNGGMPNPIDKTYQVTISCGETEDVSFP